MRYKGGKYKEMSVNGEDKIMKEEERGREEKRECSKEFDNGVTRLIRDNREYGKGKGKEGNAEAMKGRRTREEKENAVRNFRMEEHV